MTWQYFTIFWHLSTKLITQVCIKVPHTHKKHFTCDLKKSTHLVDHISGGRLQLLRQAAPGPCSQGFNNKEITHKPSFSIRTQMTVLKILWATVLKQNRCTPYLAIHFTLLIALLRDWVAKTPVTLLGGWAFHTSMEDFNSTTEAWVIHIS